MPNGADAERVLGRPAARSDPGGCARDSRFVRGAFGFARSWDAQGAAYVTAAKAQPPAVAIPKHSYTSCDVNGPYIAMTFDDGPSAELTPKLLDILKERGIKATFFVVGQNAAEYPDILRRMASEGHEVANHSWSHPALTKLGADGVRRQMENTSEAIARATGRRPVLMRPPYGGPMPRLTSGSRVWFEGRSLVRHPLDWISDSNRVQNYIIENAHPGAIILSHDIHATTVAAMPGTLDALLAKGYKFVTVSELIAMEVPATPKKEPVSSPSPAPR